ncbi:MAG: hypothetical protein IJY18_00285 [Clostridia bacterium]|nr:hypothetical protein [Clostridia bacterium]
MNFPIMVDNAYYCLRTQSPDEYKNQIVRLISDAYYALDRCMDALSYSVNKSTEGFAFSLIKNIMLLMMTENNSISYSKEYDVYCRFCQKVGYEPVSQSALTGHQSRLTDNNYINTIKSISYHREKMNSTNYQNLIYGLIMLAIIDEGRFTEDMYTVLKPFFNSSADRCPSYRELMSEVYG